MEVREHSNLSLLHLSLSFSAKYLQNGQVVEVEDNGGLLDAVVPMDFLPGFSLEGSAFFI